MELHVYSGADGEFTLHEDDGTSLDYQQADDRTAVRRIHFTWTDSTNTLQWIVSGSFVGVNSYTEAWPKVL
jgi:Domain of unknown function (DUF5110)